MSVIHLNINGKEVKGNAGDTVLDIAKANGIHIPTMCFDERVEIYGSCGLCVVEVEGIPKLLRACATVASDGMVINTNSATIRSSRKTALDLLLSDHVGDCHAPCKRACPGQTDCQGYVGLIANGEFKEAVKLIKDVLPLPASIGRVCPHPCEDACRRELVEEPISIAYLKSFVGDIDLRDKEVFMPEIAPSTGKKVGIIGGGPGGLSAAYFLLASGHDVTIYDAMPEMGGMLRYGIPEYRLPGNVIDEEVAIIENMGAKLVNNMKIGQDIELDYLRKEYDAIYVSIGAWESSSLRCEGEDLPGVVGGIDFLRNASLNVPMNIGEKVAVVGGGNTAMDAARTAVRLGAKEVYVLYRRTEAEMPAEEIEIVEGREEGVTFKFLVSPTEIIEENGRAGKIKLQKMELGEEDASGRRRPVPVEGEFETLDIDLVIGAIGQQSNLKGFEDIKTNDRGNIAVDDNVLATNLEGVFAGGDVINRGADIAIKAIGDAKKAADIIDTYLGGIVIPYEETYSVTRDDIMTSESYPDEVVTDRKIMPHLSAEERLDNFQEVNQGFDVEEAMAEAARCLECGCHDVFECKLYEYANEYEVTPELYQGEVHYREEDDMHPFIIRNTDKCILCGLCVRVCDEVMDNGALGLVDRGFDTIVKPQLDLPLVDSNCISCGQCVSVCPVGAIQERLQIPKSVPLEEVEHDTVCSYCSVGCNINLTTKGDMLYRALPQEDSEVDSGLLCVKGRFGYNEAKKDTRLTKPLVRKNGQLVEVEWEEGLRLAAKKLQSLKMKYSGKSVGLTISDRYTNEEIYLAKKFANDFMDTDYVTSFNRNYGAIADVLGYDASTNTFDELELSEYTILVGSDIMKDHTIAALKVKKAAEKGGKLVVINDFESHVDEWATTKIEAENNTRILKEILKALIDNGAAPTNVHGFDELKASLEDIVVSEKSKMIAEEYSQAKKAIIVFDPKYVTKEAEKLIADIAVVSGQIGKARRGLISLKPKNNSQGLVDMGIQRSYEDIAEAIEDKTIRGLFVIGEDIDDYANLDNLDFLVVQDLYLTPTAQKADVVLPAVSYAESQGTFTNAERRIQRSNSAIPALSGYQNWEVINQMMFMLGMTDNYSSVEEITEEISKEIKEYTGAYRITKSAFWPIEKSNVLYADGFNFEDKKAKLQVVEDGEMFKERKLTDFIENEFEKVTSKIN